MKQMMIWPAAFLSLTSCAVPGDFCEVVPGQKLFDPETSRVMVRTDRPDVEQIRVENEYWLKFCQ